MILALAAAINQPRAADGIDPLPGTIEKPGFDRSAPIYIDDPTDIRVNHLLMQHDASYVSIDDRIPSQVIIVSPKRESLGIDRITSENVEMATRDFLASSGILEHGQTLELAGKKLAMNKIWFVNFLKIVDGIPLYDAGIGLAISPRGRINLLWGDLSQVPASPGAFSLNRNTALGIAQRGLTGSVTKTEYMGQVIFPLYFNDGTEYHPAYRFMIGTIDPFAEWEVIVDAENGQILQRLDKIYYDVVSGNISGQIQPATAYDDWVDRDFFHMNLEYNGLDSATTDTAGNYSINVPNSDPFDVYIRFRGPFLDVMNDAGSESEIYNTVDPPDTFNVYWDDSNSLPPERDAWYSGNTVHRWITALDPDLGVMDFPMTCNVNVYGTCNAFWSGWALSINFYVEGGGCPNIAQIADVVYHEYGHGITDLMTRPLGPDGAMHEGFSDYTACTITNQSHVGRGFEGPGTILRDLQNNRRYPRDWNGESHNDGLIIGGALWDTRQALSPYPMGYVDSLWHFARYAQTQNFEDYFWAFAAEDDDDGDISNGTPHAGVIFHAFGDLHGIGPGTAVEIIADTLVDTEDTTHSHSVNATISSVFTPMADSVILYYNTGSGFTPIPMTQNGPIWTGSIPPQPNGTYVNYYVLAVTPQGFRGTAPRGAPANFYHFYVGPDIIPPAMSSVESPPNTVNLFGPYGPFIITAQDINGIDSSEVLLHYAVNSGQEEHASLAPTGNAGEYALALIDLQRQLQTSDTIHFYFTALDRARVPNLGRLPGEGTFNLSMTTSETFEYFERYGMDRWAADSAWVLRNEGHNSSHCIWIRRANYPDDPDAYITMGFSYDLSPYPGARVTFYRKSVIVAGDTCFVEATGNDGLNWTRVGAITAGVVTQWRSLQFDISSILSPSGHGYKVRFHFFSASDSSTVGILIDDIGWSVDPSTAAEEPDVQLPDELSLHQNFPNPFNPETKILFTLPTKSNVRLDIFDVLGRRVFELVDREMDPGSYGIIWKGTDRDGNPVSSGVYFYRLTTDWGSRQAKMTLLR
jgi:hypothetical protein